MTEDVTILDEHVERTCKNCKTNRTINRLGMCAEAARLVQNRCLICMYSKNAAMIQEMHRKLGIDRSLEDNWEPIEV